MGFLPARSVLWDVAGGDGVPGEMRAAEDGGREDSTALLSSFASWCHPRINEMLAPGCSFMINLSSSKVAAVAKREISPLPAQPVLVPAPLSREGTWTTGNQWFILFGAIPVWAAVIAAGAGEGCADQWCVPHVWGRGSASGQAPQRTEAAGGESSISSLPWVGFGGGSGWHWFQRGGEQLWGCSWARVKFSWSCCSSVTPAASAAGAQRCWGIPFLAAATFMLAYRGCKIAP